MFTGLNQEICAQAWAMVDAAIARGAADGIINKYTGTLVVLDPVADDGSILFTAQASDENDRTLEFATGKARLVHRVRRDSSQLRTHFPHLYAPDDIKYPGGIIRDGLIVAYSGVQGEADEMIAEWFVSAVRGICRLEWAGAEGGDAQPTPYLGRQG